MDINTSAVLGVQVVPLDETTPIVEGDEVALTCRSKTKDMVQYSWRWLPLHPKNATNDWLDINETRLPVGRLWNGQFR